MKKKTFIETICMYCKKSLGFKEGDGETGVSHGICKECMKKHYPEYYKEGKEMKFKKYLYEETYNIESIVDKIFKQVIIPFIKRRGKFTAIDLRRYLSDFMEKYPTYKGKKYKAILNLTGKKAEDREGETQIGKLLGKKIFIIKIFFDHKKIEAMDLDSLSSLKDYKFELESYKLTLQHELVHILDTLRAQGIKKKEPKKYDKTPFGYLKDESEFNAVIHELKTIIKTNKILFEKMVRTKEQFLAFLEITIASNRYPFFKEIFEDKFWYKKIILRLNRENLIDNLKESVGFEGKEMNFKERVSHYLSERASKKVPGPGAGYERLASRLSKDLHKTITADQVKGYLKKMEKEKTSGNIEKKAKKAKVPGAYEWAAKYNILKSHFSK